MKLKFKYFLLIFNVLATMAILGSYASQYIPPDKWWTPSLLGLAYPYFLIIHVVLFLIWLLIKPVYSLISGLSILIGIGLLFRFVQISGRENNQADIRLVSYNVKNFSGQGRNASPELAKVVKSFLKQDEPDIICLQEVGLHNNRVFNLEETKKEFSRMRHFQFASATSSLGLLTLTRFPIVKTEQIKFQKSGNTAISTDMVVNGTTIRIFNVHLQSYNIDPDNYEIIEKPLISEKKDFRELRDLFRKYKKAMQMRAVQARLIREKIKDSPYPVIVCGDFNDTPASYVYREIRGRLRDAFVKSGKGVGLTYIGKLPSFRIDYILYSRNFKSHNFIIHNIPYSDHLPISCGLNLK